MKRVRLLLVPRKTMFNKYYRAIRSSLSSAKVSVPFPKDTSWSCPCSYSPSWWGGKLWLRWRAVEWARWANGRRAVQTLTGSRQSIAWGPPVCAATRRQITKVKLGAFYQCIYFRMHLSHRIIPLALLHTHFEVDKVDGCPHILKHGAVTHKQIA